MSNANHDAHPERLRLALKLATGADKTTVMAMVIAWQNDPACHARPDGHEELPAISGIQRVLQEPQGTARCRDPWGVPLSMRFSSRAWVSAQAATCASWPAAVWWTPSLTYWAGLE